MIPWSPGGSCWHRITWEDWEGIAWSVGSGSYRQMGWRPCLSVDLSLRCPHRFCPESKSQPRLGGSKWQPRQMCRIRSSTKQGKCRPPISPSGKFNYKWKYVRKYVVSTLWRHYKLIDQCCDFGTEIDFCRIGENELCNVFITCTGGQGQNSERGGGVSFLEKGG